MNRTRAADLCALTLQLRADIETPRDVTTAVRRYYLRAKLQLEQLEEACREIRNAWPVAIDEAIKVDEHHPLGLLSSRQGFHSDTCKIYCAMTIESFLNEFAHSLVSASQFKKFDGLSVRVKVEKLLVLHKLGVAEHQVFIDAACTVMRARNDLVHFKPMVLMPGSPPEVLYTDKLPEDAQKVFELTQLFLDSARSLMPATQWFIPLEVYQPSTSSEDGRESAGL